MNKWSLNELTAFLGTLFVMGTILAIVFILLIQLLKKLKYKQIFITATFIALGSLLLYTLLPELVKRPVIMNCLGTMLIWSGLTFIAYKTYKAFSEESIFLFKILCMAIIAVIAFIDIALFYSVYRSIT